MTKTYSRVVPLFIRNGLFWEKAELYWLEQFLEAISDSKLESLKTLDLPMEDVYQLHWSLTGRDIPDHNSEWSEVYLPGRNLILLSKTVVFCALNQIRSIALGPLKTNLFSDSSASFFSGLEKVAEEALSTPLEILRPFSDKDKTEVLKLGAELPLELTFSCISPQRNLHCGACNKCAERIEAFAEAGISDKTIYFDRDTVEKKASTLNHRE